MCTKSWLASVWLPHYFRDTILPGRGIGPNDAVKYELMKVDINWQWKQRQGLGKLNAWLSDAGLYGMGVVINGYRFDEKRVRTREMPDGKDDREVVNRFSGNDFEVGDPYRCLKDESVPWTRYQEGLHFTLFSISEGDTFLPPDVMMISFFRSMI